MTAKTAQGSRLLIGNSPSAAKAAQTWTVVSGFVNATLALPIAGDLDATNLASTEIEMVDDLVEETVIQCAIQQDMTEAAHRSLLSKQAAKTLTTFLIEVPEVTANKFTAYLIRGYVRNLQPSLAPRTIQQASFDLLTRQKVTVSYNQDKEA